MNKHEQTIATVCYSSLRTGTHTHTHIHTHTHTHIHTHTYTHTHITYINYTIVNVHVSLVYDIADIAYGVWSTPSHSNSGALPGGAGADRWDPSPAAQIQTRALRRIAPTFGVLLLQPNKSHKNVNVHLSPDDGLKPPDQTKTPSLSHWGSVLDPATLEGKEQDKRREPWFVRAGAGWFRDSVWHRFSSCQRRWTSGGELYRSDIVS